MPWCPECDEIFPEGPACPRCRTMLLDASGTLRSVEGQGELPKLKVSRGLQRAFERQARSRSEPGPPRGVLLFAIALLLFAGGFLTGRMGSLSPDSPAIRTLETEAFPFEVDGSVGYVRWAPDAVREPVVVRHDVASGGVETVARLDGSPFDPQARTRLETLDASVAVALREEDDDAYVGAFPAGRALPVWLEGADFAWAEESTLLTLDTQGRLRRWSFDDGTSIEEVPGRWAALYQTPGGAALEAQDGERRLIHIASPEGMRETMELPEPARVLAVAGDGERAFGVFGGEAGWWDGDAVQAARMDGYEAAAASHAPDSRRVAVSLREEGSADVSAVGIVDAGGSVALKPLRDEGGGAGCAGAPGWAASERWVYVAPGNGSVYAVEVVGGRIQGLPTRVVGCGLGWMR